MLHRLTPQDYRQLVKEWVMKQPDDRPYNFASTAFCVVGQFLHEHPEYSQMGSSFGMHGPIWNATHGDTYYLMGSAGGVAEPLAKHRTFGGLKAELRTHPAWQ